MEDEDHAQDDDDKMEECLPAVITDEDHYPVELDWEDKSVTGKEPAHPEEEFHNNAPVYYYHAPNLDGAAGVVALKARWEAATVSQVLLCEANVLWLVDVVDSNGIYKGRFLRRQLKHCEPDELVGVQELVTSSTEDEPEKDRENDEILWHEQPVPVSGRNSVSRYVLVRKRHHLCRCHRQPTSLTLFVAILSDTVLLLLFLFSSSSSLLDFQLVLFSQPERFMISESKQDKKKIQTQEEQVELRPFNDARHTIGACSAIGTNR